MSTEYQIAGVDSQVEIRMRTTAQQKLRVLASLQDCAQGTCGCPTDQYDRLESMDVDTSGGSITVRLQPLPGEHLDTDEIRTCLEYTLAQIKEG